MAASGEAEVVALLHALALLLYVASATMLIGSLVRGASAPPAVGVHVGAVAFGLHTWALVQYVIEFDELPLVGLAPSLSAIGWLIGAFLIGVVLFRDASPLAVVLVPLVTVLVGAALALGVHPSGEPLAFRGLWFRFHVLAAFIGYAGLAVGFAAGLLYLLQFRELKAKRFGKFFEFFPSLDTLDRVGRRALLIGFPAHTLALLVGWAWTLRFHRTLAVDDPKVLWGVLTWLVFGAMLLARSTGADRDRRGALASVIGFGVVVVAYIALRLLAVEGRGFL